MEVGVNRRAFGVARIKAGFSRRGLSEAIGASPAYISQIEKGTRYPSPGFARKICEVLRVPFEEIFFADSGCKSERHLNANAIATGTDGKE